MSILTDGSLAWKSRPAIYIFKGGRANELTFETRIEDKS